MQNVSPSIKHCGGEIMIWGSMFIYELGLACKVEECINQHHSCEILEQNVCKTM